MKTLIIGAFLTAGVCLIACRKEKLPQNVPAEISSINSKPADNVRIGKYVNPFENLGIQHNQALEYVTHAPGFPDLTNQQLYDAVYPFTSAYYHHPKMSHSEYQDFRARIDQMVGAVNSPSSLLLKAGKISLGLKSLMDEFYQVLAPFGNSTVPMSSDNLNAKVLSFEQSVVARFGMPSANLNNNTDIAAILANAAVARHSYSYWYDAYMNSSNPWYPLVNLADINQRPNWRRAWNIVKADVVGFFNSTCLSPLSINLGCSIENSIDASAAI
jgi:hypothetical protein